jgi:hypothetical protein
VASGFRPYVASGFSRTFVAAAQPDDCREVRLKADAPSKPRLHVLHVNTCYTPYVKSQNITLKLPSETIRKAKIVAAGRGASISALMTAKIEELVGEDARYLAARRRALEWLSQGWHLGGGPSTTLRAGR